MICASPIYKYFTISARLHNPPFGGFPHPSNGGLLTLIDLLAPDPGLLRYGLVDLLHSMVKMPRSRIIKPASSVSVVILWSLEPG
jgi:hypothetical protein